MQRGVIDMIKIQWNGFQIPLPEVFDDLRMQAGICHKYLVIPFDIKWSWSSESQNPIYLMELSFSS